MTRHLIAFIGAALILTAATAVSTCGVAHAETIDRIVAKINDDIITLNDVRRASSTYLLARGQSKEDADGRLDELYQAVLTDLIDTRLLIQEAKALQLEVSEEDVNNWIQNTIRAEGATEDQFRAELRTRGVRWQDYRRFIRDTLLKVRVVQVKIASRIQVTDLEVERRFAEKFGAKPGDGVKFVDISHIQIPFPEERTADNMADMRVLVGSVRTDLAAGKAFVDIAKRVSVGPTAKSGGHLGKFKKEDLNKSYRVVFDLQIGDVTDPIELENGIHFLKVNDVFTERDPKIDQRMDAIRNQMLREQREKELTLWLESLRKRSYVKVTY